MFRKLKLFFKLIKIAKVLNLTKFKNVNIESMKQRRVMDDL